MNPIVQGVLVETSAWFPRLLGVLLVVALFFVISKTINKLLYRISSRFALDRHVSLLLSRTSRVVVFVLGFVTVLGTLGIHVSALIAGLGLVGFAVGFALKDSIANVLSGVLILLYKPFSIGNTIKVAGFEGVITSIDLRYTEIETDISRILIPNSKLFSDPVTVYKEGA